MATTIQVAGPTKIQVNIGAGLVDLGYSDNDSLASLTFTDHLYEVKTNERGDVPAEVVVTGLSCVMTVTLVKWDAGVWQDLIDYQRSSVASAPYTATIGRTLVNDYTGGTDNLFAIKVLPSNTGATAYQLNNCYLFGDTADGNFGNAERRLTITVRAIARDTTAVVTTSQV
jgi:hypothetical protein